VRNNSVHAMFPDATHDEQAQQSFIKSLRAHVSRNFNEGNRALYEDTIVPEFEAEHGRAPRTRKELREAFAAQPHHQWWSSMMRTTQEILYDTVGPSIERQLPELTARAKALRGKIGSLTLNENVEMPRYLTAVDIHCKPGSYHTELMNDDVFAGAEFDRTYRLYSMGAFGRDLDDVGVTLARWVKEHHPDLQPKRILDLGCTVGHSTGAYCKEFPDAEVHAIDVAAPCLRYGHARAVAMGNPIHFAQMNAENMDYEDDYFDLIVSHAFLHETSYKAIRNIFKECQRVLKPGGLMAHSDGVYREDAYSKYFAEWNAIYNNEPYLGTLQDEDFESICRQAGFPPETVAMSYAVSALQLNVGDERAVRKFGVVAARN
jgi:SAM-dependent methyltransferase